MIQNVIRSVNSDTELVLAFAPSINLNNAKYVISTTVPDTVSDGVRHMVAINAYIILFLQNMDRWMSESGKVEVEMPNGQKVTLDSIRALQAAMEGKLVKEQNGADIPNKPAFVNNIGLGNALKVGDYGVGSINGRGIPGNDYNNAIVSGIYAGSGDQPKMVYIVHPMAPVWFSVETALTFINRRIIKSSSIIDTWKVESGVIGGGSGQPATPTLTATVFSRKPPPSSRSTPMAPSPPTTNPKVPL
ncbi:hypothetical protein [Xenorhabdus bovienii]|uniref:hypothetical protein n=1 Tax=Xenorhabdus bovienii TaxID=40576 RepID=UPI0023B2680A|nr:hypothetical protein [Xenorhabdus bovienii]